MADDPEDYLPAWVEVLGRPPIQIGPQTLPEDILPEVAERLEALLSSRNGLKPTIEGWRQLAIELALEYEPAFQIETPVDRNGRSGIGGRPSGWSNWSQRSLMKQELRNSPGISNREAARRVSKRTGHKEGSLKNVLSIPASPPDAMRVLPYKIIATRATEKAARELSQE
ncbi:hypothetical protein [Mesorhizobium sp. INR15]|uniref:hypothetical protein n=1 Tax=Mesorhizobium sp. INR15 TaxID=2654248 RepID=UPI0018966E18|nr:hypothetical protein [Mesorhizobium sp. INR15]QPC93527.1 hypothetical protein GA829_24760 [Mesorhizobium sp. INR15]